MVGATPQPPQPQQVQQPSASSAEEEALKRNTDCVYFLASPLTCKKGSECEYRHSDIARVNPRDCWYWLNGNCLNPKCAFRHPPLDGLLGTQVPTPVGSYLAPAHSAATPAFHAPYISGKQGVPCIFFRKGLCLKGDKCAFLHGPNSASNKGPQVPAASTASETPSLKKASGGLEKCTQLQKVQQIKSDDIPHQAKPAYRVEPAPPKKEVAIGEYVPPCLSLDGELSRYTSTYVPPVTNGNQISRSNRVHQPEVSDDQHIPSGKDTEEFSREPSPGFDVLVDDELRGSDYYHDEEEFGRAKGREGRNLNPVNEYDIGRSANYDSMADVDRDMYRDPRAYDSYESLHGSHPWKQHRASSERMLDGSAHPERRRHPQHENPDRIDESDLRHRLSKQRRVNGLRSVITHDSAHENHVGDRGYRGPRRDTQHIHPHENSFGSRLKGRIKLPGRSLSPVNGNELLSEQDMYRGRNSRRLSPGRPQISSQHGRLRDRMKGRMEEDFNDEGRNFGGLRIRRDGINDTDNDFAGPKSLAELKVGKNVESDEQHMSDQHSLGKRKYSKVEGHQQSEGNVSFDGPKPFSEILKRKRRVETAVSGVSMIPGNNDSLIEREENLRKSCLTSRKEELKSASLLESADGQFSLQHNGSEVETEEGMIVDDAPEDHDPESYDQREGGSDYEEDGDEDYNLDEGENAAPEEHYFDDDDGDDFAKKMGVAYS